MPDQDGTASTSLEGSGPSAEQLARCVVMPEMRHALIAKQFAASGLVDDDEFSWTRTTEVYAAEGAAAKAGSVSSASRLLAAQALTLDGMFTKMAQLAGANLSTYPDAAERYMRLALKAQANSRATLETLARLHRPNEQTVKHVHVGDGGQAVIADEFHYHSGGAAPSPEGNKNEVQRHAKRTRRTALPSSDPFGDGVPISSSEGEPAMPDARRK